MEDSSCNFENQVVSMEAMARSAWSVSGRFSNLNSALYGRLAPGTMVVMGKLMVPVPFLR